MKLSDIVQRAPMLLIVGNGGCGKTVHCLTYGSRGHLIDLDGGCQSGLKIKDKFYKRRHNIDVVRFIEEQSTVATAFKRFELHVKKIEREVYKKTWPFECIFIDSLTTLCEYAMRDTMQTAGRLGQKEEIQDWGAGFSIINRSFQILRCIDIPIVVTAHMMPCSIGIGKDRKTTWVIAMPGEKLPPKIVPFFDEVLFMTLRKKGTGFVPVIRTTPTPTIPAKTRAGIPNNFELTMNMRKFVGMCDLRKDSPLHCPKKTVNVNVTKMIEKEIERVKNHANT